MPQRRPLTSRWFDAEKLTFRSEIGGDSPQPLTSPVVAVRSAKLERACLDRANPPLGAL